MKPLSRRHRYTYLAFYSLLFVALIPFLVLYATGYRLGAHWNVFKSGGIYIYSDLTDSILAIDGIQVKKLSFLGSGFFVQDLKPGNYNVTVAKDGYYSWNKQVTVSPQSVTEGNSFLIPTSTPIILIEHFSTSTASSTKKMSKKAASEVSAEYRKVLSIFLATTTPMVKEEAVLTATSSVEDSAKASAISYRKITLWKDRNSIRVEWNGRIDLMPFFFCFNGKCDSEAIIHQGKSKVRSVDFYPGRYDVILYSLADGVYVTEIDRRAPGQNTIQLYKGKDVDFRLVNGGDLYVKDGELIGKLSL